jgi:hypothetical protein
MSTDDDRKILDPTTLVATVDTGEHGRPVLVIGDGHASVALPAASRDDADALAAARRISQAVWDYVLAVKTRGPAAEVPAAGTDVAGLDATEPELLRHVAGNSGPGWPIPGTRS